VSLLGSGPASIQRLIDTLSDEVWLVELSIIFCATIRLVKIVIKQCFEFVARWKLELMN
jgi:hypothetical protein